MILKLKINELLRFEFAQKKYEVGDAKINHPSVEGILFDQPIIDTGAELHPVYAKQDSDRNDDNRPIQYFYAFEKADYIEDFVGGDDGLEITDESPGDIRKHGNSCTERVRSEEYPGNGNKYESSNDLIGFEPSRFGIDADGETHFFAKRIKYPG